jgi:transcriptional regulator with XRE-family HTH domain
MAVSLTPEQIEVLVKARQDAHLTQLELSNRSRVALRTIKDLEAGRRTSFNESTLISLCRELNLGYAELLGPKSEPPRKKSVPVWMFVLLAVVLLILALSAFMMHPKPIPAKPEIERIDWIVFMQDSLKVNKRMNPHPYNPDWKGVNGIHINYYHLNQNPYPGEIVDVDVKWSYYCEKGSTPKYYINAFTEWEPDNPIPLLTKTLSGADDEIFKFRIQAPKKLGKSRLRVFFASSFGPISNFYGHPGDNQIGSPNLGDYLEMTIEVVKRN